MKDFNPKWVVVAMVMASVLMLAGQYAFGSTAQASEPAMSCDRALDGTGEANRIMVDLADKGSLTESDVSLFYRARDYHAHCLEVAYARCGTCGGFACPPASQAAIDGCAEVLEYEYQTAQGVIITGTKPKQYASELIGQDIHYVAFDIPLDIFAPERSTISVEVADGAKPPTIPSFNEKGDVLYIRSGSSSYDGKYKCKPVWLDSIDQHNMAATTLWDKRSTNGAHSDDVVQLADTVNCEAFANQAFKITVRVRVPE